jgi:hypothetical protein
MSYHLFRVHWRVYRNGKPAEELYSFHKDDSNVAEFIRNTVQSNSATLQYRTEGPGQERLVNGQLYNEVVHSSELGIWRKREEVTLA